MTIYTKPINTITYQDIIDFCNEQIKEGINLDYKSDFPKDDGLSKTISSFANAFGGLILLGVEDQDGKPKLPVKGVKYKIGLHEKILNLVLAHIYPPIIPEIHVCPENNGYTFCIIRIPQSDLTPHLIRHKTKIYIRTDNVTELEEPAKIEQIEWLFNKRNKSVSFRDYMYNKSKERFNNCRVIHQATLLHNSILSICACPFYPNSLPISINSLTDILKSSRISPFPDINFENRKTYVQDGLIQFEYFPNPHYQITYYEYNVFGLVKYMSNIVSKDRVDPTKYFIELTDIFYLLIRFLQFYRNFCTNLGYYGIINFSFYIDHILGVRFRPHGHSYEKNIKFDIPLPFVKLKDEEFFKFTFIDLCKRIALSVNSKLEDSFYESFYNDNENTN